MTLLVGEPYGPFGTLVPVGHTAIYLDRLCADGPFALRECRAGEMEGVAIARYDKLGHYDWLATPIMQFLYAADRPEEIPGYVTPELAANLRERYRVRFLRDFIRDGKQKDTKTREWWESAGVTFNRRLWGYRVETTLEQDLALMDKLNKGPNRHHYSINRANCANFAADVINFYYPGVVPHHGDRVADFGWMTPKFVARKLAEYGKKHPEAGLQVMEVPQLPGSLRRSRTVRGAAEAGLKTKRYLAAMFVVQPELPPVLTVLYLMHGRWKLGQGAEVADAREFAVCGNCAPGMTARSMRGAASEKAGSALPASAGLAALP
jgi:hypothetical protein